MANPFERLLNDSVFIQNAAGERAGPYKCTLGTPKGKTQPSATIFDPKLDVEEGWKVLRPLPSGKEEAYVILQADYQPGLHQIPPHWHLILRKEASLLDPGKRAQTTINISNSQGIQIGDHNVQHIANSLQGLLEEIEQSAAPAPAKSEARGALRTLIENPVVASILGGAASALVGLLK